MASPHDTIRFTLEPVSSLAAVETLWRKLERGGDASFFLSWTWMGTWLRCLPTQFAPLLLIATRAEEAIGAAILVRRTERRRTILKLRQLHFNSTGDPAFDCITIEHNEFVAGADVQRELWTAFLGWFAQQTEAEELIAPAIAEGMIDDTQSGLLHGVTPMTAFACTLPHGRRDAILARLSANSRQRLRRNLRDCEAFGPLRIETATFVEQARAWFSELKSLHVVAWTRRGRRHAFHHPFFETFHRALIATGTTDRTVQLRRVSAGGIVLGYLYDFRRNGRVSAYQSGFDGDRADLRPGYVAHLLAMEQCAADGDRIYDFLAGDNQLKRSFADRTHQLASHSFSRPSAGLRLEAAARRAVSRLRSASRQPQPA